MSAPATAPPIPAVRRCRCDNCGLETDSTNHDLGEISDLNERLDPGSTVPVGECPACHALTYLVWNPQQEEIATLLRRAAAALAGRRANRRAIAALIADLHREADRRCPSDDAT